ncbi:MAG TPA: class I SAM-dependent methyltransferase [Acidimicrobiales bacterium]|nr:class I SAM-dependent methyltransferase [Acidimicrobiales bacterium]
MNEAHEACGGDEWRELMRSIVPSAIGDADLGDDVLEVGPGYGAATDVVSESVRSLTAVEIDPKLVAYLEERFASADQVKIMQGDATALEFDDGRFTGAICFTMLHHVPSPELQDRLFAEVCRVLRPGAVFVASDNLANPQLEAGHAGDTYNPVDPATLAARLEAAGFVDVTVTTNPFAWQATAHAPG